MNDIYINSKTNDITISLSIDDLEHKLAELKRVSSILKSENIKIYLEEKDTVESVVVKINGEGGL